MTIALSKNNAQSASINAAPLRNFEFETFILNIDPASASAE
jgi:hypothetical protein